MPLQLSAKRLNRNIFDIYCEAGGVKERQGFPVSGPSTDRRILEYTQQIYSDTAIRTLICFCCARRLVDTGRLNSDIQFISGSWLFKLPRGSMGKNFSKSRFAKAYQKIGSPLSPCQSRKPDFADWLLYLQSDTSDGAVITPGVAQVNEVEAVFDPDDPMATTLAGTVYTSTAPRGWSRHCAVSENLLQDGLLCCPEDHRCEKGCVQKKTLCEACEIPICRECRLKMLANEPSPMALVNDNWYGYVEAFIYEKKVTWMEKTCATPFWTGIMLMEIDVRRNAKGNRKRHMMHEPLYSGQGRIAYKGQLFSAPMDWRNMLEQIEASDLLATSRENNNC